MAVLPLLQQWPNLFHPFQVSVVLFISTLLLLLWLNRPQPLKPNLPPSPPKFPIIGNLHQLGPLVHRSLRDLSNKYGPLMLLHLGCVPILVVSSPEIASEIIKTHDLAFANRPVTLAAKLLLYGCKDIAFAQYGEYWRHARKVCATEVLSMKRVQSFRFVREEEVALMIEKITRMCSTGAPVNLTEMLLALSNNIVSRCALGIKYEGETKFGELSREMLRLVGVFSFGDSFPWLAWMDILTGLVGRMKKVSSELDAFFNQVIDEHLAHRKDGASNTTKDFLDLLLHEQENNIHDINFNRDNIKALILDIFLGGTDTTSATIEWAIAELVKNPSTMKKVQEEVRRVVGKKSKVDEADIAQMDYLKCIVKETLRLHAPLPLLVPKETSTDTNVNGYHIPSRTRVFINAWAIQNDSRSWDRAEEFIPERFMNNVVDFKGQDFNFIPFGSGRRGCPGMFFGLAIVEVVIANLLYWFDWELPNNEELDMTDGPGFSVNKKTPLTLLPISYFS